MTSIQKLRVALWSAAVILLVAGAGMWLEQPKEDADYINQVNQDDTSIVTDFSLTDMNGQNVTAQSWPDQYKLVYFGYSNCPDICPTGLQAIAEAIDKLPPTQQTKIQPLFITIDPVRDTPEALKVYTKQFHSKILGLTGNKEQIEKITKAFKVYAARVPEPEGVAPRQDEYLMDHSDVIYLLDKNSHFVKAFSAEDMKAEDLAKDLGKIIR